MSVLFRPLPAAPASVPPVTVTVVLDGAAIDLPAGMMLAAALLARGRAATGRSLHLSAPRGPFCLMGSCFECVAEVDGRPQRTCRLVVRAGMRIALGAGRSAGADRVSPAGVVIVGAGPAGAAAAQALAEAEIPSTLLDDQPAAGGQIFRTPPGNVPPAYPAKDPRGDRLRTGLAAHPDLIRHRPGVQVVAVHEGRRLWLFDEASGVIEEQTAAALIVATGALEVAVPVPGWTLPGVFTLGGLQVLLKAGGVVPGGRVVLGGAGPLLYLVAAQLAATGVEIAAVIDAAGRPTPAQLRGLASAPGQLMRGLGWRLALGRRGIPVLHRHAVVAIAGTDEVEAVTVAPLDRDWRRTDGRSWQITADVVGLSFGLRPNLELTQLAGGAERYAPALGGWHPERSGDLESSVPNLFVAGDAGGVRGALVALAEGRIVAHAVATRLGIGARGRLARQRTEAERQIRRLQPFRDALAAWSALRPAIFELANSDTVVCRCEDVLRSELEGAFAAGLTLPRALKLGTRAGMGLCQGRTCAPAVLHLAAAAAGRPVETLPLPTVRVPLRPVPLKAFAGLDLGDPSPGP